MTTGSGPATRRSNIQWFRERHAHGLPIETNPPRDVTAQDDDHSEDEHDHPAGDPRRSTPFGDPKDWGQWRPDEVCQSECSLCEFHFTTMDRQKHHLSCAYEKRVDDAEAANIISHHLSSIRTDVSKIRTLISTKGDLLLARWMSCSEQRERILRHVWPGIKEGPWPEVNSYLEPGKTWLQRRDFGEFWLIPYFNLYNLATDANALFRLLESRQGQEPRDFVQHDLFQMDVGLNTYTLGRIYNPGAVTVHGNRFGELVAYTPAEGHTKEILGFPIAELVLRAQHLLYSILRGVVEHILQEPGTDDDIGITTWRILSKAGFPSNNSLPTTSTTWQNEPFPSRIKIHSVQNDIDFRSSSVEEGLIRLQNDPVDFHEKCSYLRATQYYKQFEKRGGLERMALDTWVPTFERYVAWSLLSRQCQIARALMIGGKDSVNAPENAGYTPKMIKELLLMKSKMLQMRKTLWQMLRKLLPMIKAFEGEFTYPVPHDEPESKAQLTQSDFERGEREAFARNALLWSLLQLNPERDATKKITVNARTMVPFLMEHITTLSYDEQDMLRFVGILDLLSDLVELQRLEDLLESSRPALNLTDEDEVADGAFNGSWGPYKWNKYRLDKKTGKVLRDFTNEYEWPDENKVQDEASRNMMSKTIRRYRKFWATTYEAQLRFLKEENEGSNEEELKESRLMIALKYYEDRTHALDLLAVLNAPQEAQSRTSQTSQTSPGKRKSGNENDFTGSPAKRPRVKSAAADPDRLKEKTRGDGYDETTALFDELTRLPDGTPHPTPETAPPPVERIPLRSSDLEIFRSIFDQKDHGGVTVRWGPFMNAMRQAGYMAHPRGRHTKFMKAHGVGRGVIELSYHHGYDSAGVPRHELREWRTYMKKHLDLTWESFVHRRDVDTEGEQNDL